MPNYRRANIKGGVYRSENERWARFALSTLRPLSHQATESPEANQPRACEPCAICPSCQCVARVRHCPVPQISIIIRPVPLPQEGRFAIVTDVGGGMRWTRMALQDERCKRGRRSRVVL